MSALKLYNDLLKELREYSENYFYYMRIHDGYDLDYYRKNENKIFNILNKIIKKYNKNKDYKINFRAYKEGDNTWSFWGRGLILINDIRTGLHNLELQHVLTVTDLKEAIKEKSQDYDKDVVLAALDSLLIDVNKENLTVLLSCQKTINKISKEKEKRGGKI